MAPASRTDPFPSVSEADAEGEIARIYAELRATLGVPMVHMVWRALAASPPALRWTWARVRPLYDSGLAQTVGRELLESFALPSTPAIESVALATCGVTPEDQETIKGVLACYAIANVLNGVTLRALRLEREHRGALPPRASLSSTWGNLSDTVLPRLLRADELDGDTTVLIDALGGLGCAEGDARPQVSLPRHLAHWPAFLRLWEEAMTPSQRDGSLARATEQAISQLERRAMELAATFTPAAVPAEVGRALDAIVDAIIPNAIGRMALVVTTLRVSLGEEIVPGGA